MHASTMMERREGVKWSHIGELPADPSAGRYTRARSGTLVMPPDPFYDFKRRRPLYHFPPLFSLSFTTGENGEGCKGSAYGDLSAKGRTSHRLSTPGSVKRSSESLGRTLGRRVYRALPQGGRASR
jgi:hypothetical protein